MVHPLRALVPALSVAAALACDDPARPAPESFLTEVRESAHGVYRFAPGDAVDVADQEGYYVWLIERWGAEPARPLEYFKYRDRAHMEAVTGMRANGWAELDGYRFHSIWPVDNHESVHAYVSGVFGLAPPLLNEGLAVAHQTMPPRGSLEPRWGQTSIDTLAARLARSDRIPALASLLGGPDFRKHDEGVTYPLAGSFVKWLLERHGYEPMKALLRVSDLDDDPAALRANFRAAFGETLDGAWALWLEGLRAR